MIRARVPGSTQNPSIGSGQLFVWRDEGIAAGVEYCYRIKVLGTSGEAVTTERCLKTDPGLPDLTVLGGSIYKGHGYARGDSSYVTIKLKKVGMVFARDFYVR